MSSALNSPFECPVRVYIEDTDAGGIVYYVNYLKFAERARTEFFRQLGIDKPAVFSDQLMFVVHSLTSRYIKPARLDDQLWVSAEIIHQAKSYFVMNQAVYRQKANDAANSVRQGGPKVARELLCEMEVKVACVDRQSIKPKKIPAAMLDAIGG